MGKDTACTPSPRRIAFGSRRPSPARGEGAPLTECRMLFWIVAAVLTAAVVAALLRALLKPPAMAADGAAHDRAVYRDQLTELERDRARGLITADQAEAARIEIARRLLAADARGGVRLDKSPAAPAAAEPAPGATPMPPRTRPSRAARWAALALMVVVPVAALAIYLPTGRPGLPSQPLASRDPAERNALRALIAETDALARRLAAEPGDGAGWVALGQRYNALERYDEAAAAFGRAAGIMADNPAVLGAYGEALINAAGGTVTEQARAAFERALAARPGDPRPRFYLALARAQAGDDRDALARWQELMRDSPANAPWVPTVRTRIAEAAGRLGLDVAAAIPAPAPTAGPAGGAAPGGPAPGGSGSGGPAVGAPGGPTAADIAAAQGLSAGDQAAMIRGMVERLAARLRDNPGDLEGWLRLAGAYRVLGEPAQMAEALSHAAALAPDDRDVLSAYADALVAGSDGQHLPPALLPVLHRLLALDANDLRALWFLGVQAVNDSRPAEARALWTRLLAQLDPGTPEHEAVQRHLSALPSG